MGKRTLYIVSEKKSFTWVYYIFLFFIFFGSMSLLLVSLAWGGLGTQWKETFPKLMGMNIGAKNYHDQAYQQQLARLDIVILGFYRGWNPLHSSNPVRTTLKKLKSLNPNLKIGQYTILNEAYDNKKNTANMDQYHKLYKEGWWLKDSKDRKVQWTSKYSAWDINFTQWSLPDSKGRRYPEWLAERNFNLFFSKIPEFDIWYFDNVMINPRIKKADWNLDGKDEKGSEPEVAKACRKGHVAEWNAARPLAPELVFIGNPDNDLSSPEYKEKLQGAFLEALMGKSWSLETWQGWSAMMKRYRAVIKNTIEPRIIGFNVCGVPENYRFFRYAFTSCLLDDGYFSFTDKNKGYSSVPWFDEYDVDLGIPIDPPQTRPWKNGVFRRRFENGVVLVNPNRTDARIEIEPGYKKINGKQDKKVNNGEPVSELNIPCKDGVVLVQ